MLNLFLEYFKIGIFAIGGGYATIPFLFHLTEKYPWFTKEELTNIIAISNLTPGPVGINMATYSGFTSFGFKGSLISTMGIILGPFIITLITIYFINKFKNTKTLKEIFEGLRPASCALLTFVLIKLCNQNFFAQGLNLKAIVLCALLFMIYPFTKKNPSLIILAGGILGLIFGGG